jgi:hypothetical protein
MSFEKIASLRRLRDMGLNIVDFVVINNTNQLQECGQLFESWGTVGIRSDAPTKTACLPCAFDQTPRDAMTFIGNVLADSRSLVAIAIRAIPLSDALLQGKYYKSASEEIIECFTGPGDIRNRIEDGVDLECLHPVTGRHVLYPEMVANYLRPYLPFLNRCLLERFRYFPVPFCVEWSLYPYEVGTNKERFVYWEILGGNQ